MSDWASASCPVWDTDGYKTITNYIKQLSETDGNISSTIILHTVGTISSKDKKFYNLAKRYNPEWFVDIDPLFIVEFFVRDYNNPLVDKIVQKALSFKPDKITEGCGIMKLHIKENLEKPYAEVQVGMKWSQDEFLNQCTKIRGNKAWIESRWNSLDSDEEHREVTIYDIVKGDNCDILVDPKYPNEWYGKIYVNSAINLEQFYPDYWNSVL